MVRVDADQNLVFGALALQMDFISREALIAATSAWVVDKKKALAQSWWITEGVGSNEPPVGPLSESETPETLTDPEISGLSHRWEIPTGPQSLLRLCLM